MPSKIILFLFLSFFSIVLLAEEFNHITIKEIDGRSWLADSHGNPFFAHGITHVRNLSAKLDHREFSKECKKLGFNAYGYGCPPELRSDMPYLEGWNHLVPISYYRGDGSHKYVDVFDPKVKARLETGVRAVCLRNRSTSTPDRLLLDRSRFVAALKTQPRRTGLISSAACLPKLLVTKLIRTFFQPGKALTNKPVTCLSPPYCP